MRVLSLGVSCLVVAAALGVQPAGADEPYPSRPIEVIVPATPGGPLDTAMRMIEPGLSSALGQSLVILNRPGASGTIGLHTLAKADPNGYTIGEGVNSIFTVTRVSGTSVPFTLDDFTLLGNFVIDVSVLAVRSDSAWRSLADLTASGRANPGKFSYASAGAGTVSSLSMRALLQHFALDMTAVPFAGGAQVMTAVLGKHVDIGMVPYSTGAAMFRDGKLRGLVTTAAARLHTLPDVPTLGETGIDAKGLNLVIGLYAPRGLSDNVRTRLVAAVQTAIKDPAVVAKIESIGLFAQYEDPDTARRRLEEEYRDVVRLSGASGR